MWNLFLLVVLFSLYSPLIPLIYLFHMWVKTEQRVKYSTIMLSVSVVSYFLGNFLADKARGLDGLGYIGIIYVGLFGAIMSLFLLIYSIVIRK